MRRRALRGRIETEVNLPETKPKGKEVDSP
jgi:hypothetical protein